MKHIALFFLLLTLPVYALSRDYQIKNISINAQILSDGTVRYAEDRWFEFDGKYSEVFYVLPLEGFDAVDHIQVHRDGIPLTNDNTREMGTFRVDKAETYIEIAWPVETLEMASQHYTISFDLVGAVVIGPEYSEWFWTFISSNLDRTPKSFDVSVELPEPIETEEWHVWFRETPDDVTRQLHKTTLRLSLKEDNVLGHRDEVKARMVFPTHSMPRAPVTHPDFSLDHAMAEEEAWIEAREREHQRFLLGLALMFTLIPGSMIIFIWFYRNYGKRLQPESTPEATHLYSPPGDIPPSQMRMVYHGAHAYEAESTSLSVTLFDLCRKGYFRIVEKKGEKEFLGSETPIYELELTGKKPTDGLHEWEISLMEKVRERIETGSSRMDKLFEWSSKEDMAWWKSWKKEFRDDFFMNNWFDEASYKGMKLHALAQIPLLSAFIIVIVLAGPIGLAGLLFSFIMLTLSLTIPRRTTRGETLFEDIKRYRNALKKGPSTHFKKEETGRHFVYAIALGITEKKLEHLLSDVRPDNPIFFWIIASSLATNPAQIASGLTTLASSGTTSFSGSSGFGASSGVSGGGAGGGAR